MDSWPFWMFEENIKLVNEIIEEEETNRKKQEGEQGGKMPDTGQMMRNMSNMSSNFSVPKI
jgi:hypothetical protein